MNHKNLTSTPISSELAMKVMVTKTHGRLSEPVHHHTAKNASPSWLKTALRAARYTLGAALLLSTLSLPSYAQQASPAVYLSQDPLPIVQVSDNTRNIPKMNRDSYRPFKGKMLSKGWVDIIDKQTEHRLKEEVRKGTITHNQYIDQVDEWNKTRADLLNELEIRAHGSVLRDNLRKGWEGEFPKQPPTKPKKESFLDRFFNSIKGTFSAPEEGGEVLGANGVEQEIRLSFLETIKGLSPIEKINNFSHLNESAIATLGQGSELKTALTGDQHEVLRLLLNTAPAVQFSSPEESKVELVNSLLKRVEFNRDHFLNLAEKEEPLSSLLGKVQQSFEGSQAPSFMSDFLITHLNSKQEYVQGIPKENRLLVEMVSAIKSDNLLEVDELRHELSNHLSPDDLHTIDVYADALANTQEENDRQKNQRLSLSPV